VPLNQLYHFAWLCVQGACDTFPDTARAAAIKVLSSPIAAPKRKGGAAAAVEEEPAEAEAAAQEAAEVEDPAFFDKPADYINVAPEAK
jgi:hypothetical protein